MSSETNQQTHFSYDFIRLKTKPTSQLCFNLILPTPPHSSSILIVFVNGLGMPQLGWEQAIRKFQDLDHGFTPAILTYDRFGQGKTEDRDPADEHAEDPSHAHDCMAVVADLHQLVTQILTEKMGVATTQQLPLLMVGNSIGCSIIRLYASTYPGTLAGAVFLDSTLTDTDFVSIFPDPDAEDFDSIKLPNEVNPENLREARRKMGSIFHPSIGSKEGLSRRNLITLLPRSDAPCLVGYGDEPMFVDVIGHDFRTFAESSYRDLKIPVEVIDSYMNPYWHRYNEGLAKLTVQERARGPVQAPKAGHFIQADNPSFVATRIEDMLVSILGRV